MPSAGTTPLIHGPENTPKSNGLGAMIGGVSGIFFAVSGLFVKLLGFKTSFIVITFTRVSMMTILGVLMLAVQREKIWNRKPNEFIIQVLLGAFYTTFTIGQYQSFQLVSLPDAITLISCSTIFIVIINVIIYGEKLKIASILQILLSLFGCILCAQPNFLFHTTHLLKPTSSIGHLIALLVSLSIAIYYVLMKTQPDVTIAFVTFIQNVTGTVIICVILAISSSKVLPDSKSSGTDLLLCGISSVIGNVLLYVSLKVDTPLMTSIGRTSDIATSVILNIMVLDQPFEWVRFAGSCLVIIAIILPNISELCLNVNN